MSRNPDFETELRILESQYLSDKSKYSSIFIAKLIKYANLLERRGAFNYIDTSITAEHVVNTLFDKFYLKGLPLPRNYTFEKGLGNIVRPENRKEKENSTSFAEILSGKGKGAQLRISSIHEQVENYFTENMKFSSHEQKFIYKIVINIFYYKLAFQPLAITGKKKKTKATKIFKQINGAEGELIIKAVKSSLRKIKSKKAHKWNSSQALELIVNAYSHVCDKLKITAKSESRLQQLVLDAFGMLVSYRLSLSAYNDPDRESRMETIFHELAFKLDPVPEHVTHEDYIYQIFALRSAFLEKMANFSLWAADPEVLTDSDFVLKRKLSGLNSPQIQESYEPSDHERIVDQTRKTVYVIEELYLMQSKAIPHIITLLESNLDDTTQGQLFILLGRLHKYASPAIPLIESFIENAQHSIAMESAIRALERIKRSSSKAEKS